jgi:hypothetical protein
MQWEIGANERSLKERCWFDEFNQTIWIIEGKNVWLNVLKINRYEEGFIR